MYMCLTKDDIARLDREQILINETSFDMDWIIYGPAGTGKTILALNRIERLSRLVPNETHVYISKSKFLGRWVEQAALELGIQDNVTTFDSFVWNHVRRLLGSPPVPVDPSARWSEIDWAKTTPLIEKAFQKNPALEKFNLVLDEAQDIRLGFFEACKIMCNRLFILMDENQRTAVFADTKRSEIAEVLGINPAQHRYLGINYRNPDEIKNLSETFFDGDKNELAKPPPPELRRTLEAKPCFRWLPFLNPADKEESQIGRILSYCADHPQTTICVVVPEKEQIQLVADTLTKEARIDSTISAMIKRGWAVRQYTAVRNKPCKTDLCSPGIVVSTAINFKGSEFDAVFLIDWQKSTEAAAAMYTVITRARARIEVFADNSLASKSKVRSQFDLAISERLITEFD